MKMNGMNHSEHNNKRFEEDPGAMMLEHPKMYSWVQPVIMILAAWLVTSPLIYEYQSPALIVSDIVSGLVMFAIAATALLVPRISWITYANAAVGLWLLLAPLFFWAPTAAVYVTDTLIGTFLIGFSFVIPMSMQNPGPDIPPGWSYNPSTWVQRTPIGIWLMFTPTVFGLTGMASDSSHMVGALIVTTSMIAFSEVARPLRFLNVLFGVWLIGSPWLLEGGNSAGNWNLAAAGVLAILFALPLGSIRDQYGSYDPWIAWNPFSVRGTKRVIQRAGPRHHGEHNHATD